MRVGVVCEGVTDFLAIREFMGAELERRGVEVEFLQLQPHPDNTDDGGWTRVFFWLKENSPRARALQYFGAGLFEGGLDTSVCDLLVIQMDSDIFEGREFAGYMANEGKEFTVHEAPDARSEEVKRLLREAAVLGDLNEIDASRHIFMPAVESSEAWCVAAFERLTYDPEELRGQRLWNAFGICLMKSEGKTNIPELFGEPDKDKKRRERFCKTHRASAFLMNQSRQFREGIEEVVRVRGLLNS